MHKITFVLLLFSFGLHAQDEYFPSDNIADCAGAVEILHSGSYAIEFTGGRGMVDDLTAYPQLNDVKEKNSLFLKFIAPYDGKLSLEAFVTTGFVQLFVFHSSSENIIGDILDGKAEIIREIKAPTANSVALSMARDINTLPSIDLKTDETIILFFNTSKKYDKLLDLNLQFDLKKDAENPDLYKKIVDERKFEDKATFYIQVRDEETGNPVIADINIKDKRKSTLYSGSDLYFNTEKYSKLTIKCDAPGYFFLDRNVTVYPDSSKSLLISMKPVSKGKVLKIDKLEFVRGTADIVPGTEMILVRVKDFLILNADVRIEVQGHVNNEGNESLTSKKLSKKRAKKIMKYFTQSGINRKRLSFKAFGNKYPVYPVPQNEREAQANRRVEIKIL